MTKISCLRLTSHICKYNTNFINNSRLKSCLLNPSLSNLCVSSFYSKSHSNHKDYSKSHSNHQDERRRSERNSNGSKYFIHGLKVFCGVGLFISVYKKTIGDQNKGGYYYPLVFAKCSSTSNQDEAQQKIGTERNINGKISLRAAIAKTQELCKRRQVSCLYKLS